MFFVLVDFSFCNTILKLLFFVCLFVFCLFVVVFCLLVFLFFVVVVFLLLLFFLLLLLLFLSRLTKYEYKKGFCFAKCLLKWKKADI